MKKTDSKKSGSHDSRQTSQSLIVRAREKDSEAWERLVRLYSPLVNFWCQESGLPQQDVHDVYQDVFHSLARNIGKFRPIENGTFRGWLRTMTRNKITDHFRKAGRHPNPIGGTEGKNFLEQFSNPNAARDPTETSQNMTSETEVVQALIKTALANIRSNFQPQTWRAFWMVVCEGRETADVANELSMQPGTVRVAKSRVLKRLRIEIGDSED